MVLPLRHFFVLLSLSLLCLSSVHSVPAEGRGKNGEIKQKRGGSVVVKEINLDGVRYVAGEIELPVEQRRIWSVICDYDNACSVFKNLSLCKELEATGNLKKVRQVVKPGYFPFTFDYVVSIKENPPEGLTWTKLSGPFREFSGYWKVEPLPRTGSSPEDRPAFLSRVTYAVHLDPGLMIPEWLMQRSLKSYMPEVLNSLKRSLLNNEANGAQPRH